MVNQLEGSIKPVTDLLDSLGVAYKIFKHFTAVNSLEQAAAERSQQPEQVVRSILFRISNGKYVLVLIAGPEQLSWTKLRRQLGLSRISLASPEEVLRVTGYQIGAVTPVGVSPDIPILVDRSVLAVDEISIGSGVRGVAIILRSRELVQALGDVELGEFKP